MLLHLSDFVGVFAFAFFGAGEARGARLNTWGLGTCAFLTALGGGTIRAVILNKTPVYFTDYSYLYAVASGACCAVLTAKYAYPHKRLMVAADAVGMAAFAYIGAYTAAQAHLGLAAALFFALLTACGGGVLCDLLTNRKPHILTGNPLYPLPVVAVGLLCYEAGGLSASTGFQAGVLAAGVGLQITAGSLPLIRIRYTDLLERLEKAKGYAFPRIGAGAEADELGD